MRLEIVSRVEGAGREGEEWVGALGGLSRALQGGMSQCAVNSQILLPPIVDVLSTPDNSSVSVKCVAHHVIRSCFLKRGLFCFVSVLMNHKIQLSIHCIL